MPRRLTGVLIYLLVSVSGWTQGVSALLRSDDFKTKVELAKALQVDTLPAFKMQWEHLKQKVATSSDADGNQRKSVLQRSEWVSLTVLTRRLPQQASTLLETQEKQLMDSLYEAIQRGADFEALAVRHSNDAWLGKTVRMPLVYLLTEWNTCISSIRPGQVSRPFYSPLGIHMLRWTARGYREEPETQSASYAQTTEEELRNALLVASFEKKYNKPIAYTEEDLDAWFRNHKEDYAWELPHYRGVVVHCRDKKKAKRIRKSLKKMTFDQWTTLAEEGLSQEVRMECGLFQIGTNPYVDKLVFKCGSFDSPEGFPYTFVLGKTLKKGPEDYRDVRDRVVTDYLEAHKDDWLDRIKKNESQKE